MERTANARTHLSTGRRTARLSMAALALFAAVGLAACGDDSSSSDAESTTSSAASTDSSADTSTPDSSGDAATIGIATFQFDIPESVPAGTITVTNSDDTTHTFTADDRSFDVEVTGPDGSGTIDVEAGTYPVHCEIHPSMTGTLVVS